MKPIVLSLGHVRTLICGLMPKRFMLAGLALLFQFALVPLAPAAITVWTAGSTSSTNWSDGANWAGGTGTAGVPASTDDVVFGAVGAAPSAASISNVVDSTSGNFGGTISSLSYTNNVVGTYQNTLIAPGVTLTITNNTGPFGTALFVGTPNAQGSNTAVFASISGPGAVLNINNTNANISITRSGGSSALATLLMTNLDTFTANVNVVAIGDFLFGVGTVAAQGSLYLAKTNTIITTWVGSHASPYSTTAQPTNAIQLGVGSSSTLGGINALFLGLTNAIFADSIGVGGVKAGGSAASPCRIAFAPIFTNSSPTAYFRGVNGPGSRIFLWGVGDTAINSGSSAQCFGNVDLSGGSVDALVDSLILGRDRNGSAALDAGAFTFTAGNVDVNTLMVGDQGSASTGSAVNGTMTVNGGAATLVVNTSLELGHTTLTGNPANALNTRGVLNIINGTVKANNVLVGASSTTNIINLSGATLLITNALATNASGLFLLTMTNSTLGFTITDTSRKAVVQTLTTGGATNTIQLASVPVFASYPIQIPLIRYTTLNGAGFNIGLTNIPDAAPGAYLSNNTLNASIDLVLPVSPAPVITSQPPSFAGNPGSSTTFTVLATGNPTLSYQWYYTNSGSSTLLSNGPGPSGVSTLSGSTTNALSISNATNADSGGFFVVITNSYGSVTSSVALLLINSGAAPIVTGPSSQTIVQGNNVTFSASVAANPAADILWQINGTNVPGTASSGSFLISSISLTNVQYPANDQEVFSLIATNSFGAVTNSATLTVIVPPVITNQPVSLVVTNTQSASFTVGAGGVPPPTYQWIKNGVPIDSTVNPTATNATFTIASASPSDTAMYKVFVQNPANTLVSSNVTLTVNSLMTAVRLTPANGATGICYDTPLTIAFSQVPVVNTLGTIRIYNVTNPATPVDTLNLAQGNPQTRTIGGVSLASYPVIVNGTNATIYPHSGVMTSNQTYYVIIDNGALTDGAGAFFTGITDPNAWKFTTKPAGPLNPTNLVVAADGSGDFATVQGAADFIPNGNTNYTLVNIRAGTYTEIVRLNTKNNITFRGQDRHQTIIAYANNNNINGGTATRPMFGVLSANDVAMENLTLTNTTPKGGSQAEALYLNVVKRFIFFNCDLGSYQDTLLVNANGDQAYFLDNLIQGDTDFIWGGGTAFFTNCEIRTLTSGSSANYENITQPRTVAGTNGLSFVNCLLSRLNNTITNGGLGRSLGFADGNAAYIHCLIDAHIVGWQDPQVRYWEFGNSNVTATLATNFNGTQLAATDPNLTNAETANLWLYGWQPALAPNIIAQPADVTVTAGETATLTVGATGIPDPVYQWLQNGTNAPNPSANGATLVIPNAQAGDAATYSVTVSNSAGVVTSSTATLTVITPASPVISSNVILLETGNVQFSFSGTQSADYRVWATTDIALSPVVGTWTQVGGGTFGATPVTFTDLQATNFPQRFYIITSP